MDWNAETDLNLLKRIVALLLGLAALADRASDRSCAVRCKVLGILREGEVAAHAALSDWASDLGAPALPQTAAIVSPPDADSPSDAGQLALRLRALALLWANLLMWFQTIAHRQKRDGRDALCAALGREVDVAKTIPAPARPGFDTS